MQKYVVCKCGTAMLRKDVKLHSCTRVLLSSEIKRLRSEAGLSQADLAELSGVRQATISDVERGDGNVTLNTIDALSKALKATPNIKLIAKPS